MRYLRNRRDGTIYEWNPILAENPLCQEVTPEEAYPERFPSSTPSDEPVSPAASSEVEPAPKAKRGRPSKAEASAPVDDSVDDLLSALGAEAARGWPK